MPLSIKYIEMTNIGRHKKAFNLFIDDLISLFNNEMKIVEFLLSNSNCCDER